MKEIKHKRQCWTKNLKINSSLFSKEHMVHYEYFDYNCNSNKSFTIKENKYELFAVKLNNLQFITHIIF